MQGYQPHPTAPPLARLGDFGPATRDLQAPKERYLNGRRRRRELEDAAREAQARLRAAERERDVGYLRLDESLADGGQRPDLAELRQLDEAVKDRLLERDAAAARVAAWTEHLQERELELRQFVDRRRFEVGAELMPAVAEAERRVRAALRELQEAATALEDAGNRLDSIQAVSQGATRVGAAPVPPQHRSLGDVLRDASRLADLPLVALPVEYRGLAEQLGMVTYDREDRRIPASIAPVQRVVVADGGASGTETDVLAALQAQLAEGTEEG